jgi:competence protein ComFC
MQKFTTIFAKLGLVPNLFFSLECLHCGKLVLERCSLCSSCKEQLVLLSPFGRCRICFSEECGKLCPSHHSREEGRLPLRVGAAFENMGPPYTMACRLKQGQLYHLAKDLAAWMVVQMFQLNFPIPDRIVPMPCSWMHRIVDPWHVPTLIAKSMRNFLQLPVSPLLKISAEGVPDRISDNTEGSGLAWRKKIEIADQKILLVEDCIGTGRRIYAAARLLQEGFPSAIFAIAACR